MKRIQARMVRLGIAAALGALAACSGDSNVVRDVALASGAAAEPKPAPDFVASTRPAELDYIRPGLATRSTAAKSAAEVQALEAKMEQARAANEAKAAAARKLGSTPNP